MKRKELVLNVKKFQALQKELEKYNATSETVNRYFWNLVRDSIACKGYSNPTNKDWKLDENVDGVEDAVKRLSHQAFTVFRLIQESEDEETEELIKYYGL